VLDAGRSSLVFTPPYAGQYCSGPIAPLIDVAAGHVAYSIERPTAGQPAGSRILVRSLASGAVVRTVTRPRQVYALALSNSAIAWAESLIDDRFRGGPYAVPLSGPAGVPATVVDWAARLAGSRLAASREGGSLDSAAEIRRQVQAEIDEYLSLSRRLPAETRQGSGPSGPVMIP
jgi:hypothetical protein